MLIERRLEAVSRQEIFDRVWADVVVSDGALSQGRVRCVALSTTRASRLSSAPSHGTATSSCIPA